MFDILDGVAAETTDIINRNGRPSAMRIIREKVLVKNEGSL